MKFCECGCNNYIINKPYHKRYGIPRYIHGHNRKNKKRPFSSEHKNKLRESRRKGLIENRIRIWNKGLKGYLSGNKNPMYGKHLSDEQKKKMAKGRKNKGISQETKEKISKNNAKYWLGKKRSLETKEKISKINKGKKLSVETIQKIRNYNKKPENIKKFRERMKNIILPKKDSSIEVKIQNFLKQLGIEFFTHQYIKEIEHGYQCDILIPSMNLVIECDGDYWHKYPVGRDIDHIRTKELLEKGFKVLRLWEFEIRSLKIRQFENRIKYFREIK